MKTDDRLDFHSAVLGLLFMILKRGQCIDNRLLIATFSITVAPLSSLAAFGSVDSFAVALLALPQLSAHVEPIFSINATASRV